MKYVGNLDDAKSVVHDAFLNAWERMESLPADTNYRSYLFTAVRNRSLNLIRDRKKNVGVDAVSEVHFMVVHNSLEVSELEREIELGIQSLPDKCREIFELNRSEGLKYSEIAGKLNISVKTVEAQMSKALRLLKEHLGEFLSVILWILG